MASSPQLDPTNKQLHNYSPQNPKDQHETILTSRKHPGPDQPQNQTRRLRKLAKPIKRDHELAMELWSTESHLPRLLAILIMDNKLLSQDLLNKLDKDIQDHTYNEKTQLMDWLM